MRKDCHTTNRVVFVSLKKQSLYREHSTPKNKTFQMFDSRTEAFEFKGDAEDSDRFAVSIAQKIARRLVQDEKVTTLQILGLARALYALERLPASTPWVFVEYGVRYYTDGEFSDRHFVEFLITSDTFEIRRGVALDFGLWRDTDFDPGWYFDVYGKREADCQLWQLENEVSQLLGLGGEIYVYDESEEPK